MSKDSIKERLNPIFIYLYGGLRRFLLNLRRRIILRNLSGSGIEIGALHRPVLASHLSVTYVDRLSVSDLRLQYPELADESLVEPGILDDAESLEKLAESSQDFVIANHVIEHMRNPIQALLAWQRVLKPGGVLFLAVPDRDSTFDRDRELTPIDHLVLDYSNPSSDRDFEAFLDFSLNVSCKQLKIRPETEYKELARELYEKDYSIHYHVWNYQHFRLFLDYLESSWSDWNMEILKGYPTIGQEFIFLLKKL